jgi:hypothetical protein
VLGSVSELEKHFIQFTYQFKKFKINFCGAFKRTRTLRIFIKLLEKFLQLILYFTVSFFQIVYVSLEQCGPTNGTKHEKNFRKILFRKIQDLKCVGIEK